jgi:hypothetical protein
MKDSSKIPLGQLGWVVFVAVAAAPIGFFYLAQPKERPPAEPVEKVAVPRTKLSAVGLRENRDWDGLPDIFALWSAKAHWRNDRTRFSYWNPGTQSRSYFFEARRTAQGVRFREIPEPTQAGYQWDPDVVEHDPLCLYLPIRGRPEDPVKPLEPKPRLTPTPGG